MPIQFREPCTRSIRSLFKTPLTTHLSTSRPFIQGYYYSCQYSTTTTSTIKVPKKKASRLWSKYETTLLTSKQSLDTNQYDILIESLLEKATHGTKTGFWQRIIQAFEDSKSLQIPTSPTMYLAALKAYGRSRNKLKVTSIFKDFESQHKLNSSHYGHYLTCLIDCGELTMARRVLQKIQYNPSIARTEVSIYIASFVTFCIKRDNLPLAIQTIQSHHGFEWDKQALSTVIQTLLPNNQQPHSFESFISNSIETSVPTQHIPFTLFDLFSRQHLPTLNTCHLLLDLHIRQGDNKRLKLILIWMQQLGIQPNLETIELLNPLNPLKGDVYKSCLKQLEKIEVDNISKLKQFIHSNTLEKEIGKRWLDRHGLNLDGHALLLENLISQGEWNQCILEFNRLQSQYPNIHTHRRCVQSLLISHFSKGEDWMVSERILKEYSKHFRSTNTGFRILETMINLVSRTGQSLVPGRHVLKTLEIMEHKLNIQFSAHDISQIILQLGNHGDIENGYRLYNYVRAIEGDRCAESAIYRALMESATRNNDTRRLERAWVDMQYRKRYIGNTVKQEPNLIMYNILLNGFASRLPRPDLSHVRKLYQRMLKRNLAPDIVTYNILIKSFVNANNMEAASQIFKKMTESGIEPDTYTTNTILNGWIIRKDWKHVENFMKDINNHLDKLDIVTFNLLVQSFLQLDSKTMNYIHVLKHQNKWKHIEELNDHHRAKQKLKSKKIWSIFESSTGYSKQSILNPDQHTERHPNAFINLFSKNTEPDQVTYKLFMKAFDTIGDQKSHSRIYQWMKYKQVK